MENALKWYKRAYPVAVIMTVVGVSGLFLDFYTHHMGNGGRAYMGNYVGLEPQLWASVGLSALLILMNIVLFLFALKIGGGRNILVSYSTTCIVLLVIQIAINLMAVKGPLPEMVDSHTRRMYLGYLSAIGAPAILPKVRQAVVTGGKMYGQSLMNRRM